LEQAQRSASLLDSRPKKLLSQMKSLKSLFFMREMCYNLLKSIKGREEAYKELNEVVMGVEDEKEIMKRN
jgi:predicted component of type VI protein secretion system